MTFPFQRANALGYALYENFPSADATLIDLNAASAADGSIWSDVAAIKNMGPPVEQIAASPLLTAFVWEAVTRKWLGLGIYSGIFNFSYSYDGVWFSGAGPGSLGGTEPSAWPCAAADGTGIVVVAGTAAVAARLVRSPDGGETWARQSTVRSAASTPTFIEWVPTINLFVLGYSAADNTNIETSPDGITWTQRTLPNSLARRACATNGLIIVVTANSSSNKVITSSDAITWTERTMPATKTWSAVCWSNQQQKFIALSSDGLAGAISDDGVTWTALPVGANIVLTTSSSRLMAVGRVWVVSGTSAGLPNGSSLVNEGTMYSIDNGATWRNGIAFDNVITAAAASPGQVMLGSIRTTRSSLMGGT